jgi:membrane-bound inhibitor of C-type lysozyme
MRLHWTFLTLATCAVVGCSRTEENAGMPADAGSGAPAAAGASGESETAAVSAPYAGHDYSCPDGVSFNARLDKGNALLTMDGKTLTLAPVKGAYDAQYSGEDVLFTARGSEAMLTRGSGPTVTCQAK